MATTTSNSLWMNLFAHPEKFLRYDGQFLYPPRVEHKLQPKSLEKLDTGEYIGQPKFNGSNTSVTLSPTTAVVKERHNKFYGNPPKFSFNELYRGAGYMCLTGEFMNKSKKDAYGKPFYGFCIWDIVAYDNLILIGSTPEERLALLNMLYPKKTNTLDGSLHVMYRDKIYPYAYETDVPYFYTASNYYSDFEKVYEVLSKIDMIEGFILKRRNGRLEMMAREANNIGWSVKCRKPTDNYLF